jgi:hypothetical protein
VLGSAALSGDCAAEPSGVRGPHAGRPGHYGAGTSNRVSMVHTVW